MEFSCYPVSAVSLTVEVDGGHDVGDLCVGDVVAQLSHHLGQLLAADAAVVVAVNEVKLVPQRCGDVTWGRYLRYVRQTGTAVLWNGHG